MRSGERGWASDLAQLVAFGRYRFGKEARALIEDAQRRNPDPLLAIVRDCLRADSTGLSTWVTVHVAGAESTLAAGNPRDAYRRLSALHVLVDANQLDLGTLRGDAQQAWLQQLIALELEVPAVAALEDPVMARASLTNLGDSWVDVVVPGAAPLVGFAEIANAVLPSNGRYRYEIYRQPVEAGAFRLEPGASNSIDFELLPARTVNAPWGQRVETRMTIRPVFFRTVEHDFSCFLASDTLRVVRLPRRSLRVADDSLASVLASIGALAEDLPPEELPALRERAFFGTLLHRPARAPLLAALGATLQAMDPQLWPDDERLVRILIGFVAEAERPPERAEAHVLCGLPPPPEELEEVPEETPGAEEVPEPPPGTEEAPSP